MTAESVAPQSPLSSAAAFSACEQITRDEARNFSYGIRLLPAPKRRAMSALYAFARRIDDIADGDSPVGFDAAAQHAALDHVDTAIAALSAGELPDHNDPVLVGVHHAVRSYPIPVEAFGEIVEGCRRDVDGTPYKTLEDTEEYCRLVAGSVGRLSLGVFGCTDRDRATPLADDLGVGLQITNILRDILEDRTMDRVYLPSDVIHEHGCDHDLTGPPDQMVALVRFFTARAEEHYAQGRELLKLLDRPSRSCVAAMSGIYHQLLLAIDETPAVVLERRLSLSTRRKLWVAGRSLVGVAS